MVVTLLFGCFDVCLLGRILVGIAVTAFKAISLFDWRSASLEYLGRSFATKTDCFLISARLHQPVTGGCMRQSSGL